jgi:hypothetical protein
LVQFVHIPPASLMPRPRRQNGLSGPSFAAFVPAGEALLIALMAASRR